MSTIVIVLNIVFAVGVLAVIAGGLLVAIAMQHRDHGVVSDGPLLRRRGWSRTGRKHARPVRPWVSAGGQVWPAA